jgi:hypothetical protein
MNLPFTLPDWLPAWAFLLLALPVLLFALAFLMMPFSVFGVKARLESLEAQIDSLHEEVRNLAIRSTGIIGPARPVVVEEESYDALPNFGRLKSSQKSFSEPPAAPPIPPPPFAPVVEPREKPLGAKPALPPRPARRMEPRLD